MSQQQGGVNALSAVVTHDDGKSNRCPVITRVTIKLGDLQVAEFTKGGKYSQQQAIKEFVRMVRMKDNSTRILQTPQGWDAAVALKLIPAA